MSPPGVFDLIHVFAEGVRAGGQRNACMAWGNVTRTAWSDKFRQPTIDELRGGLNKPLQQLLDDARERLAEMEPETEWLVWQGVPWRWTLVYLRSSTQDSKVLAYIIPDPARLQICVPLSSEQIEKLPMKRMKKSIRDGVVFARHVAGVSWPTWDIPTKNALDEVFELIARKHALVRDVESDVVGV